MAKVEFDNKKMWESVLSYTHCHKEIMKDHLLYALNDQGLEYKNGEIVCVEPKEKERDNFKEVKQHEPEQESLELKEFENRLGEILIPTWDISKGCDSRKDVVDYVKVYAKELLSIARKQLKSEQVADIREKMVNKILTKRDIDTYIGQVKNAREAIPYSHQTFIWNVLADLEDDLKELKTIKEE